MKMEKDIWCGLEDIRKGRPLVHHITNYVVMNETANITLALGALPVMAHAHEEVEEMVAMAGALVINIGTLDPYWVESMMLAGRKANALNIPIVLDPVGVGATKYRTETVQNMLSELKIAIVRGNEAEVAILAGEDAVVKGVESDGTKANVVTVSKKLASKLECVVAVTGPEDIVSDGTNVGIVRNGDAMMGCITGTGCMSTTIAAGFASVEKDYFKAAIGSLVCFGLAGQGAASKSSNRPGSFHTFIYDELAQLDQKDIIKEAKVEIR